MDEIQQRQLKEIREFTYQLFHDDPTGHDYEHMRRVAVLAKEIAKKEDGDLCLCEAAGWLHDVGDRKLFPDPHQAINEMNVFLDCISIPIRTKNEINHVISTISFKTGKTPSTWTGKIVQDADRLDAIGAIGIARTFQYGGANNQLIYKQGDSHTSIQHFHDKLLKIKDRLHTSYAKQIAEERHRWMLLFLDQFHKEWGTDKTDGR
ncbi:HD domain-containing protein [Oceanobacillus alkalisoli]|uniref:HD domain-containing protein n=1 Tax=Oceanobacillus alkalisoli TaxID=2925113 RepID=UPI001EF0ED64|nr:HD domain-containing protein [Oceanobacillus alkalisoli]MCF3941546.1 HD domain-containing protein [Oceanobacillus alkalisoli]MCG5102880.1 HD domain-containing protein [Oceanobacillus alkalisoli]